MTIWTQQVYHNVTLFTDAAIMPLRTHENLGDFTPLIDKILHGAVAHAYQHIFDVIIYLSELSFNYYIVLDDSF